MDGTVLVADDDRTIRTVLTQALTRAGCKVHATGSLVMLKRWVEEGRGDLVISDVVMPDGNGLETLPEIARIRPGLPVIVISAQNTIMTAIQAAEAEAFDYLPKPFDLPDLMKRTARGLARKRLRPVAEKPQPEGGGDTLPLVGRSPAMQALYRLVARVMNTDLPVLVTGASGTGKSLITRVLHDYSDRRELAFIIATAESFASPGALGELVEKAGRGTLVFDEVSDLDSAAQARLTRLLDTLGDSGPRILATTQAELGAALRSGSFREDLFFRLSGVSIPVPALRERIDDIDDLAAYFLAQGSQPRRRLSREAGKALRGYKWPGNVRQLENTMQRLMATGSDPEIGLAEVEAVLGAGAGDIGAPDISADTLGAAVARNIRRYFDLHGGALPPPGLYGRILHEVELPLIEIALDATGGNQAKCAELLGINRNTLRKKLTMLEIEVTRRRKLM